MQYNSEKYASDVALAKYCDTEMVDATKGLPHEAHREHVSSVVVIPSRQGRVKYTNAAKHWRSRRAT